MSATKFITALCTPLSDDDAIHVAGLEAHIEDQLDNGIDSLLVAGTMGFMQVLSMETYLQLVAESVRIGNERAELLVGVGDTGTSTTLARIRAVENLPVDGLVIVSPYFLKYTQAELIDYFTDLADASKKPLFLYDLPRLTGTKLEISTVLKLSEHPNIHGIKCSDDFAQSRPLLALQSDQFRVIIAQPTILDVLLKAGVREHLDGVFGFAPHWIRDMQTALGKRDWLAVTQIQNQFNELLAAMQSIDASIFSTTSELLNLRGIPGRMAPKPLRLLSPAEQERFRSLPIVQQALSSEAFACEAPR
ncbi:dihydrodipicolinate synthase family protein [Blastopirellula marina]|uniref:Dihydrodipicolinate synthase n=1 Tax=Blastopirellula marina DSM 3645 TaxID=314230 RepID=A3ZXG1_9BACT|nr:dihydrodipicolinate synthase family protein [Blastopirellula marina]EAQ78751.1 dihydrodipicolinate synthase [Blastopirellula marina DSM 3645]